MTATVNPVTTHGTAKLSNGISMHYSSSGDVNLPVILLLHGFPSSSFQYRHFLPLLASTGKYRVIAPDLPSFGLTQLPTDLRPEEVTFDYLAASLEQFVDKLELKEFVMYIFDFGAPTGLRLALKRPELVRGIITQNGNAYEEGLGDKWAPLRAWWKMSPGTAEHTKAGEEIKEALLSWEGNLDQYVQGVPEQYRNRTDPYLSHVDYALNLATPEGKARQMSLFWDYRKNLEVYPDFQRYFRESNVPVLAVWGSGDGHFIPAGAEAFKRDSANVTVKMVDGSHFLLETHLREVYDIVDAWVSEVVG